MTPDDLARQALEEAHGVTSCNEQSGCRCHRDETCVAHIAINRLARAAWEAGAANRWDPYIDKEPKWLPPKQTEST